MRSLAEKRMWEIPVGRQGLLLVALAALVGAPSAASAGFWPMRKRNTATNAAAVRTNETAGADAEVEPAPREEKVPASVQFNEAFTLLTQADEANDRDSGAAALRLYRDALAAYTNLAARYPDWQSVITRHRIAHCRNQIESLTRRGHPGGPRPLPDLPAPSRGSGGQAGPGAAISPAPGDAPAAPPSRRAPEPVSVKPSAEKLAAIRSYQEAARRHLRVGEAEHARGLLARALSLDPDDRTTRLLIGLVQCRSGEYESAIHLLEQLVSEDPRDEQAYVLLGTTYFGLGRFQNAEEALQQALRLNPRLSQAHYDIAQIRLSIAPPDLKAAAQHYQKALDLGAEPDEQMNFLLILQ